MLLDVNVLLGLAWPNHQFHEAAHAWLADHIPEPWHTCALTQLGLVRLSCNPAFTDAAVTPHEAATLCHQLTAHPQHRYLGALQSPADDVQAWAHVAGHRQTTDAYLVMVAREHGTRLVTFDRRVAANPDFRASVLVLEPE